MSCSSTAHPQHRTSLTDVLQQNGTSAVQHISTSLTDVLQQYGTSAVQHISTSLTDVLQQYGTSAVQHIPDRCPALSVRQLFRSTSEQEEHKQAWRPRAGATRRWRRVATPQCYGCYGRRGCFVRIVGHQYQYEGRHGLQDAASLHCYWLRKVD